MPKVSVNIVSYNGAVYLKEALDSILKQSFKDFEIVFIDDCSGDNTLEIINNYISSGVNIVYKKNDKNLGITKSRNLALSLSSGEYIAVLDSDDVWLDQNKLQKQVNFLDNNKEHGLCGSMAIVINEQGSKTGELVFKSNDSGIRKKILLANQFINSSVLYRKVLLETTVSYDNYLVGEDYDLFLKMGTETKFFNFSEKMTGYRKHASGITWQKKEVAAKEHLNIIKKYKNKYPNYLAALIKAHLRIFISRF